MAKIQLLPPLVAERIAAGEVIERPASVVKELIENSLDAGATEVAVILENGGKVLIEVIDNGHGMTPDDLALAVKRHATSKLRELEDLEKLTTLGFRGEALPSVAAVSELSIVSRVAGQPDSFEYSSASAATQKITFGHFLGSQHGTRIKACGLFSQIPARLKFLKSQGAEVAQVREWIERLALTHPHVGFKLVSDDRTILTLRPQDEVARVKAILSDGEDYPVVTFTGETENVKVRAHWLQGLSSPQTRKLLQIINRRAVKDRVIQQALLSPFRQALLPGQFPAVALFIEVDPSTIDVNVHPTKTEIRFLQSSKIFRTVESTIESMISKHGAPGFASAQSGSTQQSYASQPGGAWPSSLWGAAENAQKNWSFTAPAALPKTDETSSVEQNDVDGEIPMHPFQAHRYTGVVFNTYLIYDLGDELGLIDQHAAHERVRYELLKARALNNVGKRGSQVLLIPEAAQFPPESRPTVEERLPLVRKLGFEVEVFGEDAVLFRAVPSEWGTNDLRVRLKSLVERLVASETTSLDGSLLMDEKLFESLASEACHSAVRAVDRLGPFEAASLVDALFQCTHPWNCPHGRPTVARVPRARFEEWFHRKI